MFTHGKRAAPPFLLLIALFASQAQAFNGNPLIRGDVLLPVPDRSDAFQPTDFGGQIALSTDEQTLVVADDLNRGYGAVYIYASNGDGNWTLQQTLRAEELNPGQSFGNRIALTGDMLLVSIRDSERNRGEVHVYQLIDSSWQYTETLVASDADRNDYFGSRISARGEWAVILNARGHIYLFRRSADRWNEFQKLGYPGSAVEHVAWSGASFILGLYNDDDQANDNGAAQVYELTGGSWTATQKIFASDSSADLRFGRQVVADEEHLVVLTQPDDSNLASPAFIFEKVNGLWEQRQILEAGPTSSQTRLVAPLALSGDDLVLGGHFGTARGVLNFRKENGLWGFKHDLNPDSDADEQAVISSSFALYSQQDSVTTLTRDGDGWTEASTLALRDGARAASFGSSMVPSADGVRISDGRDRLAHWQFVDGRWQNQGNEPLQPSEGSLHDSYTGENLALDGDNLFVPVNRASGQTSHTGAVYVFQKSMASKANAPWVEIQKLIASDGDRFDSFGGSQVAVDGDFLAVAAHGKDSGAISSAGAVYLFERQAGLWTETQKLLSPNPQAGATFGTAVELDDDLLAVATWRENDSNGAVYIFHRDTNDQWVFEQRLSDENEGVFRFGRDISLLGNRLLVGVGIPGKALLYERSNGVWAEIASLTPDGGPLRDFGERVLLAQPDKAIISLFDATSNTGNENGAVFVFGEYSSGWDLEQFFRPDSSGDVYFGTALSVSSDSLLVSYPRADTVSGESSGAVAILQDLGSSDQGDAPTAAQSGLPASYPVTIADNGPRHGQSNLHLGLAKSDEAAGVGSADAAGDDGDDGILFPDLIIGESVDLLVTLSDFGRLSGWIDFDRSGSWEDDEKVVNRKLINAPGEDIRIHIDNDALPGVTYARFRLSKDGDDQPTGMANDGEVEDYQVELKTTVTPSPTPSASPVPTPTPQPTATPNPTPSPTATPTPSPTTLPGNGSGHVKAGASNLWSLLMLTLAGLRRRRLLMASILLACGPGAWAASGNSLHHPPVSGWGLGFSFNVQALEASALQRALNREQHAVSVSATEETISYQLYGGFALSQHVDVELGWRYLEPSRYQLSGSSPDASDMARIAAEQVGGQGHAVDLSLRWNHGLREHISLSLRGGLSLGRSDVEIHFDGRAYNRRESFVSPAAGLGISYRFAGRWQLGGRCDYVRRDQGRGDVLLGMVMEYRLPR